MALKTNNVVTTKHFLNVFVSKMEQQREVIEKVIQEKLDEGKNVSQIQEEIEKDIFVMIVSMIENENGESESFRRICRDLRDIINSENTKSEI